MVNQSDRKDELLVSEYTAPTEQEILKYALGPGSYAGKCRLCKQVIKGHSIEELLQHKCLK